MKLYTTNEYRATQNWPYAITAGCVVFKVVNGQTEILLLKRTAGDFPQLQDGNIDSYHLPKGHVEIGETLEQTALRETAEEAGVAVEIQTYLGAHLNQFMFNDIAQEKTVHYFAGQWQNDLEGIDNEHSDTLWAPLDKAVTLIGGANPKKEDIIIKRLKDFLELTNAT